MPQIDSEPVIASFANMKDNRKAKIIDDSALERSPYKSVPEINSKPVVVDDDEDHIDGSPEKRKRKVGIDVVAPIVIFNYRVHYFDVSCMHMCYITVVYSYVVAGMTY